MKTPLLALTADWHVARSAWKHSGIAGDSYFALRQVVDYCLDRRLPLVAAGDLLDTADPDPGDVRAVRAALDRMEAAGLGVYYIQGQHERDSTPWLGGIHDWPTHIDGASVAFDAAGRVLPFMAAAPPAFTLYGLDWRPASRLDEALAAVPPGVTAVVCHQVWSNLMGGQAACEGNLRAVPHARLVLTGDYHKHTRLDLVRGDGTPLTALSPGSTCMQSIDEDPAKAFYVVGFDDDGDLAVEDVPLRARPFAAFDVPAAAALEDLILRKFAALDAALGRDAAALPEPLRRPLVRIRLGGDDVAAARGRIRAAAAGRYHLFFEQPPRSAAAAPAGDDDAPAEAELLATLRARGMLGVLATLPLDGVAEPAAVRALVAGLLAAADPAAVLAAVCQAPAAVPP